MNVDIYFLTKMYYTITIFKVKLLQRPNSIKVKLDRFKDVLANERFNGDRSNYCLIQ